MDRLFEAALALEPRDRASFLNHACERDEALRREVESLIASHDESGSFISSPAIEANPSLIATGTADTILQQQIGPYRIVSQIGAGGMGEVYLAQDTRLGRKVALKLLPDYFTRDEQRVRRFQQEARAASALNHPNIITIYEIGKTEGRHFIATEYVEGETLRQRLARDRFSTKEVRDIALQVASGLTAAHQAGILHRDIKPENIMLRRDGYVKVLDFGLAKLVERFARTNVTNFTEATTITNLTTEPGIVMGTPEYMSPEQARGERVDNRSDIFSFGVVMYEMLTGRVAFKRKSQPETMNAVINEPHSPLEELCKEVPPRLSAVVDRALAKNPAERYQSVEEMVSDLTQIIVVPPRSRSISRQQNKAIDSLAVLPLINASDDPSTEYLSDGITESVINTVSQLPRLRVIAFSAVCCYKGREIDPREVGRELAVRAVMTGRVRQVGDNLSIGVELVDVTDGSRLWGEQYTHKLVDIFALESGISREISQNLRFRLSGKEKKRLKKVYTDNLEAYQHYLKGRYYWNKRTEEGVKKSIEHFQEAIDIDPNYALAYAGLADCYALFGEGSDLPPRDAFPKAKALAVKALEIDETVAEAHTSLAHIMHLYDWDFVGAEREYKRAIKLKPNYATAHQWYGWYLISVGRFVEAMAQMRWAQELDPISRAINLSEGMTFYYWSRQYEQAIEQLRKILKFDSNFPPAHFWLGWVYNGNAMYKEAIEEFQRVTARPNPKDDPDIVAALGYTYAASGNKGEARTLLDKLNDLSEQRYIPPFDIALIHMGLGEKDKAFEFLEKAYGERSRWLTWLKVDPIFDSLRSDPRFVDLLSRVGWP